MSNRLALSWRFDDSLFRKANSQVVQSTLHLVNVHSVNFAYSERP